MLPQEYVARRILPVVRALLSHKLKEKGFSQQRIAEIVLVSQPMVNKYLRFSWRDLIETLKNEGISINLIEYVLNDLLMSIEEKSDIKVELASIINLLAFESTFCKKDKELCEETLMLSKKAEMNLVRKFLISIINLPGIEKLVPEVGSNIAYDPFGENDPRKMIAVEGRIVKGLEGVHIAGDLKVGGSKHTARILSLIQRLCSDFRAIFVISNKKGMKGVLRRCKLNYVETGPHTLQEDVENSIIEEFVKKYGKCKVDVILDRGGKGLEPVGYVLGRSMEELFEKIACINTNFKE